MRESGYMPIRNGGSDKMLEEIMSAVLPEDEQEELPTGFSCIGHIGMYLVASSLYYEELHALMKKEMVLIILFSKAHLNLREKYFPSKTLIASVLMDKNPSIRTVINKIDVVGSQSEFRTFEYELLAGDPDLNVEIRAEDCTFRFDYSQVYWNPRLNTEHRRMINIFQPGEAVCDVMAGIGPFAVPAGKKNVFVWANDLNPKSYACLQDAVERNKVRRAYSLFTTSHHRDVSHGAVFGGTKKGQYLATPD